MERKEKKQGGNNWQKEKGGEESREGKKEMLTTVNVTKMALSQTIENLRVVQHSYDLSLNYKVAFKTNRDENNMQHI